MSIVLGPKISALMASAANGDSYGDAERKVFRGIQALVMPSVISATVSAQPGSPSNGDMYIVPVAATGAQWAGNDGKIAYWALDAQDGIATTGLWEFYTPQAGWQVYNRADNFVYVWNGSAWAKYFDGVTGTANQIAVSASGVFTLPNLVVFPKAFAPQKVALTPTASAVTVDASQGNSFRIALDHLQPPTALTISNPTNGQEIEILFVQDSTGGVSITYPATVKGATAITTTANLVSSLRLTFDSTSGNWYTVAQVNGQ
jgi:hypothetical protein